MKQMCINNVFFWYFSHIVLRKDIHELDGEVTPKADANLKPGKYSGSPHTDSLTFFFPPKGNIKQPLPKKFAIESILIYKQNFSG